MFTYLRNYAWFRAEDQTYELLIYTSQMNSIFQEKIQHFCQDQCLL